MGRHRPRSRRGRAAVTLRKGGIREPDKHFALEHDRFFLYPTFDHQRNDLVRESHQPELRRALEEGVWADGEPPAHALDAGRRHRRSPTACASAPGPRSPAHWTITDRARRRRAVAVLRVDARLRREAPGVEAPPPAARAAAAHVPHPAARHGRVRDDYGGCRSWLEITRDLPFEGTPVLSDEEFERASEEIAAIAAANGAPAYA